MCSSACFIVCVCVSPACCVAVMALFWMIDVFQGAARSSGWARASVWRAAASLLLYICRRSKTPLLRPSDCASAPTQPRLPGSHYRCFSFKAFVSPMNGRRTGYLLSRISLRFCDALHFKVKRRLNWACVWFNVVRVVMVYLGSAAVHV